MQEAAAQEIQKQAASKSKKKKVTKVTKMP